MNIHGIDINAVVPLFGAFLRIFSLLIFMPFFSSKVIPFSIKWMLSIFLLFISYSVLKPQIGEISFATQEAISFFFIKEILVGLILGFSAKIVFEGILFACHFIGSQIGLDMSCYDSHDEGQISPVSQFIFILAILIFLSTDMHHFIIQSVIGSFSVLPLGEVSFSAAAFEQLSLIGTKLFWIVIQFSAPIAIFIFLINISFGIFSKIVPQVNTLLANLSLNIPLVLIVFLITALSFEKNIAYVSQEVLEEFFKIARVLHG